MKSNKARGKLKINTRKHGTVLNHLEKITEVGDFYKKIYSSRHQEKHISGSEEFPEIERNCEMHADMVKVLEKIGLPVR